MTIKNFFASMAAALSLLAFSTAVHAQTFEFDVEGEGEATIDWNYEFQEDETFTSRTGAEFAFNGGAGGDGEADAIGDIAATAGIGGQVASGNGNAYDYNGNSGANAEFESAAFMATGALAADFAIDERSKIDLGGLAVAGGAGSVETGRSYGSGYNYEQSGMGNLSYDVDADLSASVN